MGFLWAAIEPLIYFTVLYIVFSGIWEDRSDFGIYLISGIVVFHIFTRGTSGGLVSLSSNKGLLKSLNLKREFFPVVSTCAIALLGLVDMSIFFIMMPIFNFVPDWTIIFLPVVIFLVLVLVLGLSYLLSVINIFFKDIQNIWSLFAHSLLFISPIFWKVENVEGILLQIQRINPIGQLIEISHKLVIEKEIPPINDWLYTTLFVFSIFFFGYFVFNRLQAKIVEEL